MTNEEIVRRYLDYLEDPSILRDDRAIADASAAAEAAIDKIDRLRLWSEAERLANPSADELHGAFVACVKDWADGEGVTPGALMKLGVPPGVLAEAGFVIGGHTASRRAQRASGRRSPGVSIDAVRAAVPATGTFTTKQLRQASGASPGTVRKAMAAMLTDGTIEDRGQDPTWAGPGRVPTLYERA